MRITPKCTCTLVLESFTTYCDQIGLIRPPDLDIFFGGGVEQMGLSPVYSYESVTAVLRF